MKAFHRKLRICELTTAQVKTDIYEAGLTPDKYTLTHLITASHGFEEAMARYAEAKKMRIDIDSFTLVAVLRSCAAAGKSDEAQVSNNFGNPKTQTLRKRPVCRIV